MRYIMVVLILIVGCKSADNMGNRTCSSHRRDTDVANIPIKKASDLFDVALRTVGKMNEETLALLEEGTSWRESALEIAKFWEAAGFFACKTDVSKEAIEVKMAGSVEQIARLLIALDFCSIGHWSSLDDSEWLEPSQYIKLLSQLPRKEVVQTLKEALQIPEFVLSAVRALEMLFPEKKSNCYLINLHEDSDGRVEYSDIDLQKAREYWRIQIERLNNQ